MQKPAHGYGHYTSLYVPSSPADLDISTTQLVGATSITCQFPLEFVSIQKTGIKILHSYHMSQTNV